MDQVDKPTQKQIANGCRHFNGIQNKACEAGIPYKQFLYQNYPIFPCRVRDDGTFSGACSAFAWSTPEEIEAEEKATSEAVAAYFTALSAGLCPVCGQAVTDKRQVGRCVYGEPCGHRLYQGKLDPNMSDEEYEAQAFARLEDEGSESE
jgi:hypothetical protein